jgi:hypothetical protein
MQPDTDYALCRDDPSQVFTVDEPRGHRHAIGSRRNARWLFRYTPRSTAMRPSSAARVNAA